MKKTWFILVLCAVLVLMISASADPARFYNSDRNQTYHSEHLLEHLGSQSCKVSGNYIKVRTTAGGSKVVGHLEQADVFSLDELVDHWASITVIYSARTSPDSYVGLSGWVDADYVECPCSRDEYYSGAARTTFSRATITAKTANLRELPSKGSPNHAKITRGEQVDVLSEYAGNHDSKLWYRVRYGRQVGFVREDMLEITETGITEPAYTAGATSGTDYVAVTPSPEFTGTVPGTLTGSTAFPVDQGMSQDPGLPSPESDAGNSAGTGTRDGLGNGNDTLHGDVVTNTSWQDMYRNYLIGKKYLATHSKDNEWGEQEYIDPFGAHYYTDEGFESSSGAGEWTEDIWPIWFAIYDMDRNGVPELIGYNGYGEGAGGEVHVYTVENGQMKYAGVAGSREGVIWTYNTSRYPGIVWETWHQGYHPVSYFELRDGRITEHVIASYYEEYPDDPAGEASPKITLNERTSDDGLWNLYQENKKYWFEVCLPASLTESSMTQFLSDYHANGGCSQTASAVGSQSDSSAGSSQEKTTGVPPEQVSSDDPMDGYYMDSTTNNGDPVRLIPVRVYSDTEVYHAGVPVTFQADILGGMPPFKVHWTVEETQNTIDPTPISLYVSAHPDYEDSTEYTSNDRHVEFVYIPPVDGTTLFGKFRMTDANGLSNASPEEDLAVVLSPLEAGEASTMDQGNWQATTAKDKVNVREKPDTQSKKITRIENAGTLVTVLDNTRDSSGTIWYYIRLSDGNEGYVRGDLLR